MAPGVQRRVGFGLLVWNFFFKQKIGRWDLNPRPLRTTSHALSRFASSARITFYYVKWHKRVYRAGAFIFCAIVVNKQAAMSRLLRYRVLTVLTVSLFVITCPSDLFVLTLNRHCFVLLCDYDDRTGSEVVPRTAAGSCYKLLYAVRLILL